MKKVFLFAFLVILSLPSYSQDYRKNRKEAEKYKNECVISVKERGAMPES